MSSVTHFRRRGETADFLMRQCLRETMFPRADTLATVLDLPESGKTAPSYLGAVSGSTWHRAPLPSRRLCVRVRSMRLTGWPPVSEFFLFKSPRHLFILIFGDGIIAWVFSEVAVPKFHRLKAPPAMDQQRENQRDPVLFKSRKRFHLRIILQFTNLDRV